MNALDRLRQVNIQQVLAKINVNARNNFNSYGNISAKDHHTLIGKLPAGDSPIVWIQNPASADYGKFIFMVDYSVVDGEDIVV